MQHSNDGGVTWSAAATVRIPVTGVIPVVQPNGDAHTRLLVAAGLEHGRGALDRRRRDAGRSGDDRADPGQAGEAVPRAPDPAADVDGAGRVMAVWQDCRFRPDCQANDIVFTSVDRRDDVVAARAGHARPATRSMPTIGVEPGTGRLAIAYYAIRPDGVDAELVTSRGRRRAGARRSD